MGQGASSEFGSLDYSPLSLEELRERQEWNEHPLSYQMSALLADGQAGVLRYACLSQRGYYPDEPDKENQDAFKLVPDLSGQTGLFLAGVFDGHGEYGDDCAEFVRDNIAEYLSEELVRAGTGGRNRIVAALRATYARLNDAMHAEDDAFDAQLSGTTAVTAVFESGVVDITATAAKPRLAPKRNSGCVAPMTSVTTLPRPVGSVEEALVMEDPVACPRLVSVADLGADLISSCASIAW